VEDGGQWLTSHPGCLLPGKNHGTHLMEDWTVRREEKCVFPNGD
jgi:hypothetical protein